jgi:methionyl-tRNA formyltransferase
MTKEQLRIVFMGTPQFAVASLDALVQAGYSVVGVVTAPDKPAGRGMQLQQSAVKQYAVENGIPVLQPEKLKHPDFIEALKKLQADLQIVVAFRMLPEMVWNMPAHGTINVHASLLPQYRGAAPINWAVINGETESGVTTFKLKHEIDTGDILLQQKVAISPTTNAGELHDAIMDAGAKLLIETVDQLVAGILQEQPQASLAENAELKHAPKIFTDTCQLNFNESTNKVYNLIRGLSPYPGAIAQLEGKTFKIYTATMELAQPTIAVGAFETDKKTFLRFACPDGYIYAKEMQMEGKKKMRIEDFLRGYRFAE